MKNLLVVVSGPAGVGKGTIVKQVMEHFPAASLSVSCTTRGPREGEKEGVSYFFISKEDFKAKIAQGGFLEYSEHFNNFYGTPKCFVEEKLLSGDVLLEIDVDGALQVKKAYPEALLIMIVPPDMETLKKRLLGRQNEKEFDLYGRLKRVEFELSFKDRYDAVVINDDLKTAVDEVIQIMEKRKMS